MDGIKFLYGQVHIINNEIARILPGIIDITASKILNCDVEVDGTFPNIQTGTIYNGINTVPRTTITAYQNGYVVDQYETSTDGRYYLFLEPGEYELQIKYPNQFIRNMKSFKVENGIKEFGGIGKGSEPMRLIDKNNKPISEAKVLITQLDTFKAFIEADEDGYYCVYLEPNRYYDIQIRKSGHMTKFYKNILYDGKQLLF